ncbi:hypothetical protein [Nioella sp. MMSF_3534]|uniref:hypothetical protein n=1 Tax=Nioella sp. MMSF_3534 TaxID=3046720 RepID=UPI00273D0A00|nr:hypothetical protein [Nioella sp. MMSF_3534]
MLAKNHHAVFDRSLSQLTRWLRDTGADPGTTYPFLVYMGNWMADFSQLYSPELAEKMVGMLTTRGAISDPCNEAKDSLHENAVKAELSMLNALARAVTLGAEAPATEADYEKLEQDVSRLLSELRKSRSEQEGALTKLQRKDARKLLRALKSEIKALTKRARKDQTWTGEFKNAWHGRAKTTLRPLVSALVDEAEGAATLLLDGTASFGDAVQGYLEKHPIEEKSLGVIPSIQYLICAAWSLHKGCDLGDLHKGGHKGDDDGGKTSEYPKEFVSVDVMLRVFADHFGTYLPFEHLDRPPDPNYEHKPKRHMTPAQKHIAQQLQKNYPHQHGYRDTLRKIEEEQRVAYDPDEDEKPTDIPIVDIGTSTGAYSAGPKPRKMGIDKHLRDDIGIALRRLYEMRAGHHDMKINDRLVEIGKALHAVQDYFAHTNAIDRMIYLSQLDQTKEFWSAIPQLTKIYRSLLSQSAGLELERDAENSYFTKLGRKAPAAEPYDLEKLLHSQLDPLIYPAYFDPIHGVIHSLTMLLQDKIVAWLDLDENLNHQNRLDRTIDVLEDTLENFLGFDPLDPPNIEERADDVRERAEKIVETFDNMLLSDEGLLGYLKNRTDTLDGTRIITVDTLDKLWRAANGKDPETKSDDDTRRVLSITARAIDLVLILPFLLRGYAKATGIEDDIEYIKKVLAAVESFIKFLIKFLKAIKAAKGVLTLIFDILVSIGKAALKAEVKKRVEEGIADLFKFINTHLHEPHGSHSLIAKDESVGQKQRYYFAEDMAVLMDGLCYDLAFGPIAFEEDPDEQQTQGTKDQKEQNPYPPELIGFAAFMDTLTDNAVVVPGDPVKTPGSMNIGKILKTAGWQKRLNYVQYAAASSQELHHIITTSLVDVWSHWENLPLERQREIAQEVVFINEKRLASPEDSFQFETNKHIDFTDGQFHFAVEPHPLYPEDFWCLQQGGPILRSYMALIDNTRNEDANQMAPHPDHAPLGGPTIKPWYSVAGEEYGLYLSDLAKEQQRPYPKTSVELAKTLVRLSPKMEGTHFNELYRLERPFKEIHRQKKGEMRETWNKSCPRMGPVLDRYRFGWDGT